MSCDLWLIFAWHFPQRMYYTLVKGSSDHFLVVIGHSQTNWPLVDPCMTPILYSQCVTTLVNGCQGVDWIIFSTSDCTHILKAQNQWISLACTLAELLDIRLSIWSMMIISTTTIYYMYIIVLSNKIALRNFSQLSVCKFQLHFTQVH